MAELTCPALGTGSVDMNALSEAAKKAKSTDDLLVAIAKATTVVAPPEEPAAPAPAPVAPAAD